MQSYVLSMAGSGATSEIYADSDEAAVDQARTILGEDAIGAEQWDADGVNDDDEPCKRLLFWDDEESAENDPGVHAIAQLSTVGQV